MGPELLESNKFGPTKESDCYALGMVTLEVLSGQAPFPNCGDHIVMRKVCKGERPGRPKGMRGAWFTDDLWGMLKRCWATQPRNRPSIEVLLECFARASRAWKPSFLQSGEASVKMDEDAGIDEGVGMGEGAETDEEADEDNDDGEMDEDVEMDEDIETDEDAET